MILYLSNVFWTEEKPNQYIATKQDAATTNIVNAIAAINNFWPFFSRGTSASGIAVLIFSAGSGSFFGMSSFGFGAESAGVGFKLGVFELGVIESFLELSGSIATTGGTC